MPRISSPGGLGELQAKQSSVVSRGQLLTLGMKDNAMQYRARRGGPWQTLLPGVYLTVSGVPSLTQKEVAALLYAGPGSLITGPAALMHHSLRSGAALDIIDVLVPIGRQRVSAGSPGSPGARAGLGERWLSNALAPRARRAGARRPGLGDGARRFGGGQDVRGAARGQCHLAYFDHAATWGSGRLTSAMVGGAVWRVPCSPGFLAG